MTRQTLPLLFSPPPQLHAPPAKRPVERLLPGALVPLQSLSPPRRNAVAARPLLSAWFSCATYRRTLHTSAPDCCSEIAARNSTRQCARCTAAEAIPLATACPPEDVDARRRKIVRTQSSASECRVRSDLALRQLWAWWCQGQFQPRVCGSPRQCGRARLCRKRNP